MTARTPVSAVIATANRAVATVFLSKRPISPISAVREPRLRKNAFKKAPVSADVSGMDSVLRHRAFALLFSVFIGLAVASIPALAASSPLDAIVDEYEAASKAKLDWFETKMDGSGTA